ncbi:olfactory receptor 11A1-like [Toxotes jaculatrix]|uniref:olfactory receptor 11A1-like n=1 Tax=Toxotes jaculatrix TaxID=941984 RepID=UPI001B3AB910|nr:olfactory receptor 11A1-like [Toxotes jaculatrix]
MDYIKRHMEQDPASSLGSHSGSEEEDFFGLMKGHVQETTKQLDAYLANSATSMDNLNPAKRPQVLGVYSPLTWSSGAGPARSKRDSRRKTQIQKRLAIFEKTFMDDELNVTYISLNGYVEVKYRYVYFLIIFTVYILIICSNCTIIFLIVIHRNLHEPMYIFIAALLMNCVLYSTNIYPKLLTDFLSEKQIISYSACVFQFFLFYYSGALEFLLLSAMAYDRYLSICKPLQYPTIMRKTTVSILLLLAWIVSALHISVVAIASAEAKLCNFTLNGIFCNNSIYQLQCVRSRFITIFGVVNLLDLALLPMLFIIFTYTKIFIISYRSCREVRKKAVETCLPHLLVLITFSCFSVYDVSIARVESIFPKTARLIMTLQSIVYPSLFNPLIYGLKMREISKHLRRLLCSAKLI